MGYFNRLGVEFRTRWPVYVGMSVILLLALDKILFHHVPRVPLMINMTDSLPYTVALADYSKHSYARGDYVVYAFAGAAVKTHPGLAGQPFFKRIRGVPGDRVEVVGRRIKINGEDMGFAKVQTESRIKLDHIAATVIPPGHYYVQGTGDDSFDSRYALCGLIKESQISTVVRPIF